MLAVLGVIVSLDQELTYRLEGQGSEVLGRMIAIEEVDRTQGQLIFAQLRRLPTLGTIILFGPWQELDHQLRDSNSRFAALCQAPSRRHPFGNDAFVFQFACFGPVLAQQDGLSASQAITQCDHGLARLLVKSITWNGFSGGHDAFPPCFAEDSALGRVLRPHFPPWKGTLNLCSAKCLETFGARGFEPPTSRSRTVRSSQAELCPVLL